jgi:hypothetical protein
VVREVEALNLKSTRRVPTPEVKPSATINTKAKPGPKKKKAPKPPTPVIEGAVFVINSIPKLLESSYID